MAISSVHTCQYVHLCGLVCVSLCVCMCVEETCIDLTRAIEAGDMQSASVFAATLARQHAVLKIQPSTRGYEDTEVK